MSTTIATLKAILTMDVSEFTGKAREAEGAGERMGSNLLGGAKKFAMFGAAATAAAVPVAMFMKGAIDNASDLNETISKNTTIFGKAADELIAWADSAPHALGMTKNAALDATGTLGNLFTQLGISADAARKMSQANVQLATDFASFHNANPEEVIEAMTAAYRGEFDAVQRFVPLLNAANVEEKALLLTKKKSKDALTEQDKALAVNALMMEGAGAAAGDFARTSDSAANRARIAAASFEEMKTKLGNVLLPAWTAVLGFITGSFFPALERLGSLIASVVTPAFNAAKEAVLILYSAFTGEGVEMTGVLGQWGASVAEFGNTAREMFDTVKDAVLIFYSAFTGEGVELSGTMREWGGTIAEWGNTARRAFDAVSDAWQLLTEGTTSDELTTNLGEWGPKVKEITETVRNFAKTLGDLWDKFKGNENLLITAGVIIGSLLVAAFIALAAAAWSAAVGVIAATWPFIAIVAVIFGVITALRYAYENWEWFRNAVNGVVSWLAANVPPAFEAVRAGIAVVVDWIVGTAVPFITSAFSSFMGFLQGTLLPAVTTVWNAIYAVIETVVGIVINVVQRMTNFIADNWNWISGLTSAIWDQISMMISNTWQIISNIIQLFLNIISGNWGAAWDNIKNILSAVVDNMLGTVGNLGRMLGNVFMLIISYAGNMVGGVVNKLVEMQNWFNGLPGKLLGALASLGSMLYDAGSRAIQGLINGIKSKIGDAVGAVKDGLGAIRRLLPFSPAKEGPFSGRGYTLYSGQAMAESLAAGIRARIGAVRSATRSLVDAAHGTMQGITGSSLRGGPPGAGGSAGLTVVVNGRARSEDGIAVVNAITAHERVAGTAWRSGQQALTAAGW